MSTVAAKAGWKLGLGIAGRVALKAIPIVGWASLAYDGYQLANYAWENREELAEKIDFLSPDEEPERQMIASMDGEDVMYATAGTGVLAATAMTALPMRAEAGPGAGAMESTDNGPDSQKADRDGGGNDGKPPKKRGRLGRFGKAGLAIAAWEGAAYVIGEWTESDLDRQYDAAKDFNEEIVSAFDLKIVICHMGTKPVIWMVSAL